MSCEGGACLSMQDETWVCDLMKLAQNAETRLSWDYWRVILILYLPQFNYSFFCLNFSLVYLKIFIFYKQLFYIESIIYLNDS